MTDWLLNNWENVFTFTGFSLISAIGAVTWLVQWLAKSIKAVNQLKRELGSILELRKSIVSGHLDLTRRFTELTDRFDELLHRVVQFPDSSQFKLMFGVYWFVGIGNAHPQNHPLCPGCLVTVRNPVPLNCLSASCWECPVCKVKFFDQNILVKAKMIQP